mmetsp:Transcript_21116/g.74483  ORF Transcript_21116/g.74483 Transcript_21116/m.74483 type:complete len:266 (-) Transcript_21116:891-1688(-)
MVAAKSEASTGAAAISAFLPASGWPSASATNIAGRGRMLPLQRSSSDPSSKQQVLVSPDAAASSPHGGSSFADAAPPPGTRSETLATDDTTSMSSDSTVFSPTWSKPSTYVPAAPSVVKKSPGKRARPSASEGSDTALPTSLETTPSIWQRTHSGGELVYTSPSSLRMEANTTWPASGCPSASVTRMTGVCSSVRPSTALALGGVCIVSAVAVVDRNSGQKPYRSRLPSQLTAGSVAASAAPCTPNVSGHRTTPSASDGSDTGSV